MSFLLRNLLHFGEVLRAAGIEIPAGRMVDVVKGLGVIDIGQRPDVHSTLRALLVQRPQDFALFDEAFRAFWRPPRGEWSTDDRRALGEQRRFAPSDHDTPPLPSTEDKHALAPIVDRVLPRTAAMTFSDREVSRTKDFAEFTEMELEQARRALARLSWDVGQRRTRRWVASPHGRATDLRRTLPHNARYGGELLALPTRSRKVKRRPLVLICDVSGSMERYTRMLLHFVSRLAARSWRLEAFLFATRLTRVTRELKRPNGRTAARRIRESVTDWGGGTRIGEALHTFNARWRRRVMSGGAVTLLISDGWDRGDPEELGREMARLQRSVHRLIWLNPLLGSSDYRPLTRGMQAALPFVDDFLPVHNLESLEALAGHLNALDVARRPR